MSLFKFCTLFVICSIFLGVDGSEKSMIEQIAEEVIERLRDKMDLILESDAVERPKVFYARCEHKTYESGRMCLLYKINRQEDEDDERCQLVLPIDANKKAQLGKFKIHALNENVTIFAWVEREARITKITSTDVEVETVIHHMFKLIHFPKCQIYDIQIDRDKKGHNIVSHPDKVHLVTNPEDSTIDFVFYNESICGDRVCRSTFNSTGAKIQGPSPWFMLHKGSLTDVVALPSKAGGKRCLVITDIPEAYLVNHDGSNLVRLDLERDYDEPRKLCYSTAHGYVGLCYYVNDDFSCTQYTQSGKLVLHEEFVVPTDIQEAIVHNLLTGGFNLLSRTCSQFCENPDARYFLSLVIEKGTTVSRELQFKDRENFEMPRFTDNKLGQHCLSWLKIADTSENRLNLTMGDFCFSDPNKITGDIFANLTKLLKTASRRVEL